MANKEKLNIYGRFNSREKKYFEILFFLVVILFVSALLLYIGGIKSASNDIKIIGQDLSKKNTIVYTKQYSDDHITENAKATDSRFKNITFYNRKSLLGNAISSIKSSVNTEELNQTESGSWLWTPILQITPDYRDSIINESKKRGIKNLYVSIDSYLDIYVMPDGNDKQEKEKAFDTILADFVSKAKENGISVDAEAGWRNWAEMGNSYKAFVTLNFAIDFNKRHSVKLRGFQYDIEPYLLDYYKEDAKNILGNLINLIDESVARLDGSDLRMYVVVPEFYDQNYSETPKIYYAGENLYPFEQILRVLDKRVGSGIIIMDYRNYTNGPDGSIDIARDEIFTANKYKTKVILAVETGEIEPSFVTFFNHKKSYFDAQLDGLTRAFKQNSSFGGIAIHYINSYLNLR